MNRTATERNREVDDTNCTRYSIPWPAAGCTALLWTKTGMDAPSCIVVSIPFVGIDWDALDDSLVVPLRDIGLIFRVVPWASRLLLLLMDGQHIQQGLWWRHPWRRFGGLP